MHDQYRGAHSIGASMLKSKLTFTMILIIILYLLFSVPGIAPGLQRYPADAHKHGLNRMTTSSPALDGKGGAGPVLPRYAPLDDGF